MALAIARVVSGPLVRTTCRCSFLCLVMTEQAGLDQTIGIEVNAKEFLHLLFS